jgi:hypothetical protein
MPLKLRPRSDRVATLEEAKAAAVDHFILDKIQRNRIMVQELG